MGLELIGSIILYSNFSDLKLEKYIKKYKYYINALKDW